MNMRMIEQYHAQQRRNRALVLSLILHGIFVMAIGIWLLRPLVEEMEDQIVIDIIGGPERVRVSRKTRVKKVGQPETRKTPTTAPLQSPAAAKRLPASMSALPRVAEEPKFEPLSAATVTDLDPSREAILAPDTPDIDIARGSGADITGRGLSTREQERRGGNRHGTGQGGGGTGKGLGNATQGGFQGEDAFGVRTQGDPFSTLMGTLAKEIVETSGGSPIDVVFIIDTSGTMHDNIKSIAEHLKGMIEVYRASEIDYALGLTEFWASRAQNASKGNQIKVTQLTKSFTEYRRTLLRIAKITNKYADENALDAVMKTFKELRFRSISERHFILVTDEPFTSLEGVTVERVIATCKAFNIHVNVLGIALSEHKRLAAETGGKWHPIPRAP